MNCVWKQILLHFVLAVSIDKQFYEREFKFTIVIRNGKKRWYSKKRDPRSCPGTIAVKD